MKNEWISVNDKLPENKTEVECKNGNSEPFLAVYFNKLWWTSSYMTANVTDWRERERKKEIK